MPADETNGSPSKSTCNNKHPEEDYPQPLMEIDEEQSIGASEVVQLHDRDDNNRTNNKRLYLRQLPSVPSME
jgi:hypothetical protein